jgi:hypothetical protein
MRHRKGKNKMIERKIDAMVQRLPLCLKKEILDYVEFLSMKYQRKPESKKKFKFDWEGGLADVKDKMTSVELQHKAMDWR